MKHETRAYVRACRRLTPTPAEVHAYAHSGANSILPHNQISRSCSVLYMCFSLRPSLPPPTSALALAFSLPDQLPCLLTYLLARSFAGSNPPPAPSAPLSRSHAPSVPLSLALIITHRCTGSHANSLTPTTANPSPSLPQSLFHELFSAHSAHSLQFL